VPEASRQARNTRTQEIADAYRTATLKDAWYGPSLADLLERTSPEIAATPPASGAHSISTLLQHILLWNDRVLNTCDSTPMPRWEPEKEWAAPLIPWTELVVRWNRSRDQLEEKIRNFPVEDLAKQQLSLRKTARGNCRARYLSFRPSRHDSWHVPTQGALGSLPSPRRKTFCAPRARGSREIAVNSGKSRETPVQKSASH